jgi:NAD(P)-dependent dehydrogenase (short-subunit alcohol dehydrogenase family)
MTSSYNVKGKVVMVTGANRGIGKALVEGFLRHGARKVYAAVRKVSTADNLVQVHGIDRVVPVYMDLSKPDTIRDAATNLTRDVQIVVNNAGVLEMAHPLNYSTRGENTKEEEEEEENHDNHHHHHHKHKNDQHDPPHDNNNNNNNNTQQNHFLSALEYQMEINVYGLVHVVQQYVPLLQKNGNGAFVQINSVSSLRCPHSQFAAYSASKAASYSILQGLRDSLKDDDDMVVMSVHPGPIATDMVDQFGGRDRAEPAIQVADSIMKGLEKGDFLVYTDSRSRETGNIYNSFATAPLRWTHSP